MFTQTMRLKRHKKKEKKRKKRKKKKKKKRKVDSETDFSSDSDYDEFANEISFESNILQPFQFEPVFTAAEIQAKNT